MSRRFGTAGVDIIDITGDQELEDRFLFRVPVVVVHGRIVAEGQVTADDLRKISRARHAARANG